MTEELSEAIPPVYTEQLGSAACGPHRNGGGVTCRHLFLVGNPSCVRCYERQDAADFEWIDRRAGRSETHPTSLRAGPVPTLTLEEAGQRPPRGHRIRPTHDPKGAA